MDKYLKMADVFPIEIKTDDESGSLICDEDGIILESFAGDKVADYTLHAINSHDELVENMQHYKQEAEQWEERATKEASIAQDLEGEVERLRGEIDILNCRLEKHMERMIDRLHK